MSYVDEIYESADVLHLKHRLEFKEALGGVVFFANFGIHNYYACADALIASAKRRGVPPRHLLNSGIMNNINKIHYN